MRPALLDRRSSQAGYTLIELLVSTAIMVTVTGAIFSLMNPAQGNAQTQPEVADMQQRMRVGNETLFKELMMAGAGPYQGSVTGSLVRFFAPILPRRVGRQSPDLPTTFKDDAITLSYIPNSYSQTTISASMPNVSAELKVTNQSNCPVDAGNLCGFTEGMDVIIFDTSGNFDMFTITQVQDAAAHLQHRGQDLSKPYDVGASVTQIVSNTYYLNRTTNKLMRYNGGTDDVPLVDNVVDLKFDYFGDPNPPLAPHPQPGEANCLYDAAGNYKNLPTLNADDGSLAILPGAMLVDGPMCGGGSNQYDADLLRIRKVRVTMRVQAADPSLRGADTALFKHPGTSRGGHKYVPDYNISFEVSPRNLNLTR
jgi:prepilin-type N-terminal cleavage/methylation domain-containing protein